MFKHTLSVYGCTFLILTGLGLVILFLLIINLSDIVGRKDGSVLCNDALNTFYLRLYGVGHMVKDHSDSQRGKPAAATWATLFEWQQGFFYMHHPTERIAYTTAFVTPVVEHWLE